MLKFYLQSNAEKGKSLDGILGDWRWYRHENIQLSSISWTYAVSQL